jgi:hypothetical protein
MKEKFGADACICISDPRAFMEALSNHDMLRGRPYYQDKVTYIATNESSEYDGTDAFKKLKQFEWQKEFRTVGAANLRSMKVS